MVFLGDAESMKIAYWFMDKLIVSFSKDISCLFISFHFFLLCMTQVN